MEGRRHETGSAAGLLGRAAAGGRRRRSWPSEERLRRDLHRRGMGLRRLHAAGLVGTRDLAGSGSARRSCRCPAARPTSIAMHALTLDHLVERPGDPRHGRPGPQVVEGWYGQPFAKPLARTREVVDIIRKVLAREAPGDQRRPALPAAVRRRGLGRARQAAQADRAPAARRHPDLARRGGPEERRADRRDRRRLDPDLLLADQRRHVPAVARRGVRPGGRPPYPRDFDIAATCHLEVTDDAQQA